jgi:hypothetical protein
MLNNDIVGDNTTPGYKFQDRSSVWVFSEEYSGDGDATGGSPDHRPRLGQRFSIRGAGQSCYRCGANL